MADLLNAAARKRNVRGSIRKVTEPVEKYPLQTSELFIKFNKYVMLHSVSINKIRLNVLVLVLSTKYLN